MRWVSPALLSDMVERRLSEDLIFREGVQVALDCLPCLSRDHNAECCQNTEVRSPTKLVFHFVLRTSFQANLPKAIGKGI